MDQNIKSIPPIQLNIYQELNKNLFQRPFSEGVMEVTKEFLGQKVDKQILREIEHKLELFYIDYFLAHGWENPGWRVHCEFDATHHMVTPYFVNEHGEEYSMAEAQYLIDYYTGNIPE